jgi:hypothetical protein
MKLADNQLVCSTCLIPDGFFVNGGSHAPDNCPNCKGSVCTLYKNLSIVNKARARKIRAKLFKERAEQERLWRIVGPTLLN